MTGTKSQIAFEELGLGSVLKRYQLLVPPNQRDYAWTEREITQLLQDFARAIDEDGPYFLGTIVTIPRGEGILEVVDGQQRLATTAIILAAIRDYLTVRNEEIIVQAIDNDFLFGIDRERRVRVPRLKLNLDDNGFFNRIVTGGPDEPDPEPTRSSHDRMLVARDEVGKQIQRIVAPHAENKHGDVLNRWVSFVEHRALVVLLRVPDDANAYKMFETLNDRGLRTSQTDLIKNYLFSRSGERISEVQSCWSYMRGALESASEEPDITINFLRHALIVQRGHLREADVYDAVQDMVKSEQSAATFSGTLDTLSSDYVATFNPEHERWNAYPDATRRAIEVFNLFNIKPMRPLILGIAAKMDPKQTAAAFNFLISLGVRLIIASSTRTGSVEMPLADTSKEVFAGTINTAAKLRARLKGLTPSDTVFQAAFETTRVSNARLARYYLRSLEVAASNGDQPWFVPQGDRDVINLEHVLPRKPEDNWPQFSEDEVRLCSKRLGNVALMRATDNSDIRSQAFYDKRRVYADSPYILTKEIAVVPEWTAETISNRQKRLAALAVSAWPIIA